MTDRIYPVDFYNEIDSISNLVSAQLNKFPTDRAGRLMVAPSQTLFQNKFVFGRQANHWDEAEVSGSGTSSTFTSPNIALKVSSGVAGRRVLQTKRWFQYQSGKAQQIKLTMTHGNGKTGIKKKSGQFNDTDGVFLQQNGATVSANIRKGGVDYTFNQADWNMDKLDGTGVSGATLNLAYRQIVVMEYLWLGVDAVTFGFKIDDQVVTVHKETFTNKAGSIDGHVYMNTPNLPIRYEIENTGVTGTGSELEFVITCQEIVSSGGSHEYGEPIAVDRGIVGLSISDTNVYPLLAVRLGASYFGVTAFPKNVTVSCSTTGNFNWALLVNPTMAGTALSFSPVANSFLDVAIPTNATTVSGGWKIKSSNVASQSSNSILDLPPSFVLGSSIAGVADVLVLAVQQAGAPAETYLGSMDLHQLV